VQVEALNNMNNRGMVARKKISHYIPLVFIGIGLIIIGFVAIKLISYGSSSTRDYSVIPAKVSFPAPELILEDLNGNKVSLADFRQQILLINNWAIWCPPCKAEMPTLERYFMDHRDQGFALLGINAGDPLDQVTGFVNDYVITFPVLLDPHNTAMAAFNNDNLPNSYVIDRDGNVVLAWTGPINREMLEKYVTPLLEQ